MPSLITLESKFITESAVCTRKRANDSLHRAIGTGSGVQKGVCLSVQIPVNESSPVKFYTCLGCLYSLYWTTGMEYWTGLLERPLSFFVNFF